MALYLGDNRAAALNSQPVAEPDVSAQGDFIIELTMPVLEIWDSAREWAIVARAGQDMVEARFRVPEPPRTATPTLTSRPTSAPVVRLEGIVEAVAVEARLLTLKSADGKTYVVNFSGETALLDVDNKPIALESVRHDDKIIAEGSFSSNGTLLARRVIIARAPTAPTSTPTLPPTNTPLPVPPTATPTPPASAWRGQYYANINLSGEPALERMDGDINFNWGAGSPDSDAQGAGILGCKCIAARNRAHGDRVL